MSQRLPGEELELVLSEYDRYELGDLYDSAVRLERRGVTGLALKIFNYVIERYGPEPSDDPFDRMMGSIIYTRIARASLLKGDHRRTLSALVNAIRLDPCNCEARYYTGELLLERGNREAALACFLRISRLAADVEIINKSNARICQIFDEYEISSGLN